MLSLYQMQGKIVSTGALTSWTAALPDWSGASVPGAVPVIDVVWAGGGFDLAGGGGGGSTLTDDSGATLTDDSGATITDG